MANYDKARVKLANPQLNKLKSAAKYKTGTTLRITKKNFQHEELPHELFLTVLGKMLGNMTGNLDKKSLTDLAVPLAKLFLPNLETKAISSVLDKL